jgi:hypothetical protein
LGLLDRLEEWIYRLNEEQHWIFRLYDWFNELWARLMFRGVRARASRLDLVVSVKDCRARVRFLTFRDEDTFAEFLARLDVSYLPPHPLDRRSAGVALRRRSYIPIGIFVEGELIGYILLRIFFFRRAVTGIWMLASTHGAGIGRHTLYESVSFLEREGLPNYCTIPIGNEPSLRIAHWCGWRIIRTNRFFNVLKVIAEAGEDLH